MPSTATSPRTPTPPLAVPPLEAAHLLSLGLSRIYELMRSGQLQSYKDSRTRRVTTASINAYIDRQLAAARNEGWQQWKHSPPRRRENKIERGHAKCSLSEEHA